MRRLTGLRVNESLEHSVPLTILVTIVALLGTWLAIHTATAMWYFVPISPKLRRIVATAVGKVAQLTGRPVRSWGPFLGGTFVGRDDGRYFIQIRFADARLFGTAAGPPRQYFAFDINSENIYAVTPGEVRPHKLRWTIC